MSKILATGFIHLAAIMFLGCGETDDHHSHGGQTYLERACKQMTDGTVSIVAAAGVYSDATDTSNVDWSSQKVEVNLDDVDDESSGFVRYSVQQTALYSVFTGVDVVVEVDGDESASITSFDDCETIGAIHTFDLEAGEHVIGLNSAQRSVTLVIGLVTGSEHSH